MDSTVYGIALVITGREDVFASAVGLIDDLLLNLIKAFTSIAFCKKSLIELFFGWELIHGQWAFLACQEIIFLKTKAIWTESKGDIHHVGILLGLLHAMRHWMCRIFCLNNSDGSCAVIIQNIIGVFGLLSDNEVSPKIDFAIGQFHFGLHRYVLNRPTLFQNSRCDVAKLDVLFW